MRHALIKLFQFASNAECGRMVHTEFFSNYSRSWERISFDDCSQLVVVDFQ